MPDAGDGAVQFVTEPIVLPMTRTELADDYTLTVGFDNGSGGDPRRPNRRSRTSRRPKKTDAPN